MSHGEQSSVLDKHLPVNCGQKLLRDINGGSRCLYRRLGGHGLWTWAVSLGFQLLFGESGSALEDVIGQDVFAKPFHGLGMVFA